MLTTKSKVLDESQNIMKAKEDNLVKIGKKFCEN